MRKNITLHLFTTLFPLYKVTVKQRVFTIHPNSITTCQKIKRTKAFNTPFEGGFIRINPKTTFLYHIRHIL